MPSHLDLVYEVLREIRRMRKECHLMARTQGPSRQLLRYVRSMYVHCGSMYEVDYIFCLRTSEFYEFVCTK